MGKTAKPKRIIKNIKKMTYEELLDARKFYDDWLSWRDIPADSKILRRLQEVQEEMGRRI